MEISKDYYVLSQHAARKNTLMRYIKVDLFNPHNANVHEDIEKVFCELF